MEATLSKLFRVCFKSISRVIQSRIKLHKGLLYLLNRDHGLRSCLLIIVPPWTPHSISYRKIPISMESKPLQSTNTSVRTRPATRNEYKDTLMHKCQKSVLVERWPSKLKPEALFGNSCLFPFSPWGITRRLKSSGNHFQNGPTTAAEESVIIQH